LRAVGRWSDLHAEAGRWRHAAETAGRVPGELGDHLGRLDAAWALFGEPATVVPPVIGEDTSSEAASLNDLPPTPK
jgi:hypothetical protein